MKHDFALSLLVLEDPVRHFFLDDEAALDTYDAMMPPGRRQVR